MHRRQLWWGLMGLAGGVIVTYMIMSLAFTTITVQGIQETQKINRNTLDRLIDCTTPGMSCYQEGQRRTAEAVGNINLVIQLSAACADRQGVDTYEQIVKCVSEGLEQ